MVAEPATARCRKPVNAYSGGPGTPPPSRARSRWRNQTSESVGVKAMNLRSMARRDAGRSLRV